MRHPELPAEHLRTGQPRPALAPLLSNSILGAALVHHNEGRLMVSPSCASLPKAHEMIAANPSDTVRDGLKVDVVDISKPAK